MAQLLQHKLLHKDTYINDYLKIVISLIQRVLNMLNKLKYYLPGIILLLISGCTALQPFPNVARSGDTVALAVGSPLDMSRANTTATFTSDADGIPVDVTANIRSIFKLYADPASRVYNSSSGTSILVGSSIHAPWVSIAVIDLPTGLTSGYGNIQFNTTATYPSVNSHINDLQIPIEIIPGTGSVNNFDYEVGIGASATGNLTTLEPLTRAVFGPAYPSAACPCPDYAAIQIKTTIQTSSGSIPPDVRVLAEDLTVNTGSSRSMHYSISSNGTDLTVNFISLTAALKYYEAQFTVVLRPQMSFIGTPVINSIQYFDIDGNEVTGPVNDYSVVIKQATP